MGLQEEIERLMAAREAALTKQQIDLAEDRRRIGERVISEEAELRRGKDIIQANIRLGREVTTTIFLPVLLAAMDVLNRGKADNERWSLETFTGNITWFKLQPYNEFRDSNFPEPKPTAYVIPYDGIGLKRLGKQEKRLSRRLILGYPVESEYYQTYDIIFAGIVGYNSGVLTFAKGRTEDGFELYFPNRSDPRVVSSDVIIPQTSPESLGRDLNQVRDSNSPMHTQLTRDTEAKLFYAIRSLPEYQGLTLPY